MYYAVSSEWNSNIIKSVFDLIMATLKPFLQACLQESVCIVIDIRIQFSGNPFNFNFSHLQKHFLLNTNIGAVKLK